MIRLSERLTRFVLLVTFLACSFANTAYAQSGENCDQQLESGRLSAVSPVRILYRVAYPEGAEPLSAAEWERLIEHSCSADLILGWREGGVHIADGLAANGGEDLIEELLERSLAEGSRYLYIALAPYASDELHAEYEEYFTADDAYRDAFEARLP